MGAGIRIPLDEVDKEVYRELWVAARHNSGEMLKALLILHGSAEMPEKDYSIVDRVLTYLERKSKARA